MSGGTPTIGAVDPSLFRTVLGQFCSGITIVTSLVDDVPVGFTCQSFSSLSLTPPLVLISPGSGSTTWPVIRQTERFCINVLADEHSGLSTKFAMSGTDKFAGVSWRPSPNGLPTLDDVIAWIDCTLHAEHPGGDHSIVVGEVFDLGARTDARPLLYFRGDYARLR
jgi:3-hydroxy-9,10-secoandrosta-1,3,5(10)-triene-9,17-dione monooxygenase reductase component